MPSLWKFGGLTPLKLMQLGLKKMGEDELSTRAASLSYYFLLALFPMLLFLVSLLGIFAGPSSEMRNSIMTAIGRVAPGSASTLVQKVVEQTVLNSTGIKLAFGLLGALWAASGGVSAVVTSLNVIYRTDESRPWWKQKLIIVGLTLALALLAIVAAALVLYGGKIGELLASHLGLGGAFDAVWKIIQWPAAVAVVLFAYSIVYYYGPDLEVRKWYWVTPGAAVGVALWLVASIAFRVYLHFFNTYTATYGSLGTVIILMIWLFLTGIAVLIGAEVNWVIENEDKKEAAFDDEKRSLRQRLNAA